MVVKLVADLLKRALTKVPALHRTRDDGSVTDFVSPIVSLVKAVLAIFVLIAILEHFGLMNVLDPLKLVASEFAASVPDIIGAAIIPLVVYVAAKFVVFVLNGLLEGMKFDDLPEKIGIGGLFLGRSRRRGSSTSRSCSFRCWLPRRQPVTCCKSR